MLNYRHFGDFRRGSEYDRLWAAAWVGRVDIVERFAPKRARYAPSSENYKTALMIACEAAQAECVEALLPWSDVDACEPGGCGALMWAARSGDAACVRLMLAAATLDKPMPHGATQLIDAFAQAAILGARPICSLFQEAAGGFDHAGRDGQRAADHARKRGHHGLAQAIEARAQAAAIGAALGEPAHAPSAPRPRL